MFRKYMLLLACLGLTITAIAEQKPMTKVASSNCGEAGRDPFLVKGDYYTLPNFSGSDSALKTCSFGRTVVYAFDGLDIQADYRLEAAFLIDGPRRQRLLVDGNELSDIKLEADTEKKIVLDLPKRAYAYGQLVLLLEALSGPNAIISEITLYSSNPKPLTVFDDVRRQALRRTSAHAIDTTVDPELILPTYTPIPHQVKEVYTTSVTLNGTWAFNENIVEGFHLNNDTAGWKNIQVPGQWSLQGFDVDSAAFGGYRKTFTVPSDWTNQRIKLRFDGVSSECRVFLNGEKIGEHLGGMTAFELDITDNIHKGENLLALAVRNESMADMLGSLTQYAAHSLGGITRKVTLFAVPQVHLSDLRILTDLDNDYRDANLDVSLCVTNQSSQKQDRVTIRLSLAEMPVTTNVELPEIAPGATWKGVVRTKVASPAKWNNEQPFLYTLQTELLIDNAIAQRFNRRFGFREVEVRKNELLVNGQSVKLRGVCRHEIHPLAGRVVPIESQKEDVLLFRAANCNFIRTSHYPPTEEFLALCDELGMFVEVEAPIGWVGHGANLNWGTLNYLDKQYYPYILQSNLEMIHQHRNHPSVLFWSIANESYWNKEFAQIAEYVRKADPTRPYTFHDQAYGGYNNQGSTAPVANFHYPGPNGDKQAALSDRPMIFGEYCHLNVYNREELVADPGIRSDWGSVLLAMWEKLQITQGALGGSIWSGIDDLFQLPDGRAVGYGPWGPIDGWRRTKPEYWDMKKVYSPIKITPEKLQVSSPWKIEIENRYEFLNINDLLIRWNHGAENGTVSANIAPGNKGALFIDVKNIQSGIPLHLSFIDPRGFVVDQYKLPVGDDSQKESTVAQPKQRLHLKTTRALYLVTGDNFECRVNRLTGQITSLERGRDTVLSGGPFLMALPLKGGACAPDHNADIAPFNDICNGWSVVACDASTDKNGVTIKVEGSYDGFVGGYTLRFGASGETVITYSFKADTILNPRQWGMVFEAPKQFNTLSWKREALWSTYPDDHIARAEGSAPLFYPEAQLGDPRIKPSWSWSKDFNALGSNDFRSTKQNIVQAGLCDGKHKVDVVSSGKQHWRSWLEGDRIRFLIAEFSCGGSEMFLAGHYATQRRPIKKGDTLSGVIVIKTE